MPKKFIVVSFVFAVLLTACGVSLAGDVTPPPNYKSPTPPAAQTAVSVSQPLLPPDPAQGAAIYTEKCAPCHGNTGLGDGDQAAKLGIPVAAIGTADLARNASPSDWYDVVTNGRMENGMPPFRSLTDRQRWDVIAYVFTLSATQDSITQGKQLYAQMCVSCHGVSGQGDGADAASLTNMPNWNQPGQLEQRSATNLVQVIDTGAAPSMPAYAGQLSQDQEWALADYIRTFSFAGSTPGQLAQANTPDATQSGTSVPTTESGATAVPQSTLAAQTTAAAQGTPAPFQVTIGGKVTNTDGSSLPSGLSVTLEGYDDPTATSPSWSAQADVQSDGSYRFENVDVPTGRTFLATVTYKNVPFQSTPLHASDLTAGQVADLPIVLTGTSSDASVLAVSRMHVFFDFSQTGIVQVAELFIVSNPSSKAVVPAAADKPVVNFILPAGAQDLTFDQGTIGTRYVSTDLGFGDLTPIQANDQLQVLFGYTLPYTGEQSLSIPMTMPVDATVVMVPSGTVSVTSQQLTPAGTQTVDGANIQIFTANALKAGDKLDITLSGQPSSGLATGAAGSPPTTDEMVIGIGVFGVVLLVAGVWLFRRRRTHGLEDGEWDGEAFDTEEDGTPDNPEALLDAIVALDDLYQAGELPDEAYHRRRAVLKERLRAVREN